MGVKQIYTFDVKFPFSFFFRLFPEPNVAINLLVNLRFFPLLLRVGRTFQWLSFNSQLWQTKRSREFSC